MPRPGVTIPLTRDFLKHESTRVLYETREVVARYIRKRELDVRRDEDSVLLLRRERPELLRQQVAPLQDEVAPPQDVREQNSDLFMDDVSKTLRKGCCANLLQSRSAYLGVVFVNVCHNNVLFRKYVCVCD